MELVMRDAQIQWPYLLQLGFVWDIVDIFCSCILVPWVPTARQVRSRVHDRDCTQQDCALQDCMSGRW